MPLVSLILRGIQGQLGPDPIALVENETGLVALIFLGVALFLVLADALPAVAAAAIVAGVFIALGLIAGLLARHAIRRGRGGTGTHVVVPTSAAAGDNQSWSVTAAHS